MLNVMRSRTGVFVYSRRRGMCYNVKKEVFPLSCLVWKLSCSFVFLSVCDVKWGISQGFTPVWTLHFTADFYLFHIMVLLHPKLTHQTASSLFTHLKRALHVQSIFQSLSWVWTQKPASAAEMYHPNILSIFKCFCRFLYLKSFQNQ